ncbi:MAG: SIMPL domain-containing protein [Paraglaciecola sp.]|uniref:SIMPL domain-containing protein n=1 Tax=Paraglaciecola sp. TaxID=1920173 RepID=UPI00273D6035|nr:SIMPL domain-containing protein [Paraglaciecola sp.]MDP5031087.1 SIMPL domain-containing protein [Paraglaciecola sp.]MDP5132397.1 SIMPL domain-containing protein [Paraglaciecola sp.]
MKKLLLSSVLLLTACGPTPPHHPAQQRQITVTGVGSAVSVPDQFNFTVVIEERGETASDLNRIVNEKTNQVIEQLKKLDVKEKNIQSLQVQFNPWVEYNGQTQEQKGFILSRRIDITLDKLSLYDKAIDSVLKLNITRIEGFSYSNSKAYEHYQSAIEQALQDAQQRAEHMAEVLDLELGSAITVSEQSQGQAMQAKNTMRLRSMAESSSLPGEMNTTAQVSVVFELVD